MLAILSDVRLFLDKWRARKGPAGFHLLWRVDEDAVEFFKDLGTLRERVGTWRSILAAVEPALRA